VGVEVVLTTPMTGAKLRSPNELPLNNLLDVAAGGRLIAGRAMTVRITPISRSKLASAVISGGDDDL
jgi:hypothetical protein